MLPNNFSDKLNETNKTKSHQKNLTTSGGKALYTLVQNWLSFVRLRFTHATYTTYRTALQEFLYNLPSKTTPDEITPAAIEKFIQDVIAAKRTPKTANTYLAAIKSFYRWAENIHHIENQAVHIMLVKENHNKIRILSDKEYQTILLRSPNKNIRHAFQFLGNTGLRIGEFRSLQWSNFNVDYVFVCGKGDKNRSVPLNGVCKRIIGTHNSVGVPPFIKPFEKRTKTYRLCAHVSKIANIKPFSPHTFRHYFATRLIRSGVPLAIVSKILGHASTQFTEQVYVHLIPADLRVTDVLEF